MLIFRGPESETLPRSRGFLQTCIISKLHPRVFFSSAKSQRFPTPIGELTSSETPLPTKITLEPRFLNLICICVPEWDAKLADWLICNQAITLCSPRRACLQVNRPDTFIGVEPSKIFYILL